MSAKEKIQNLTNAWYGFTVFAALVNLVVNGVGIFSVVFVGAGTIFSLVWAWFLGRQLLRKSSLTRMALVVLSAISVVAGTLGAASLSWRVVAGDARFVELGVVAMMAIGVWMNARSFRVLTDRAVRAHFS